MTEYHCMICDSPLPDSYEPALCCNAFDCGCMGMPTNPPVCSEACYNKLPFKRFIDLAEECATSPDSASEGK